MPALLFPADAFEHLGGGSRLVQHIEVNAGRATLEQFGDLPRGEVDTCLELPVGVFALAQFRHQFVRQVARRQLELSGVTAESSERW